MSKQKPAYLIGSSIMPENHGSLAPYGEAAGPMLMKAGAEIIVTGKSGQPIKLFEGEWPDDGSLTILKFPSMEALLTFWNSPEYQAIKHLRTDVIKPNFTFAVEGE